MCLVHGTVRVPRYARRKDEGGLEDEGSAAGEPAMGWRDLWEAQTTLPSEDECLAQLTTMGYGSSEDEVTPSFGAEPQQETDEDARVLDEARAAFDAHMTAD
jgi:hypothetical protein